MHHLCGMLDIIWPPFQPCCGICHDVGSQQALVVCKLSNLSCVCTVVSQGTCLNPVQCLLGRWANATLQGPCIIIPAAPKTPLSRNFSCASESFQMQLQLHLSQLSIQQTASLTGRRQRPTTFRRDLDMCQRLEGILLHGLPVQVSMHRTLQISSSVTCLPEHFAVAGWHAPT